MTVGQRYWTEAEVRQAVKLAREQRLRPRQIGEILGRTGRSVLGKLQREGAAGYTRPPDRVN